MSPVASVRPHAVAPDVLRAVAAGLVVLSHARVLVFRDAAGQSEMSAAAAAFFAVSGLGHQAVIVFFVLSGLLVTEAMLRLEAGGRWSLGSFATARLVRLWIVLVPCLVLGGLLDRLGLAFAQQAQPYGIPPLGHPPVAPALGLDTLLGNLLFLQGIALPVFGSNGPLWSLANEAWYYALAGLGFSAWRMRRRPGRALLPAGLALLLLGLLPTGIVALAPVWLCGAAVAWLRRSAGDVAPAMRWGAGVGGAILSIALLVAARLHHGPEPLAADLALGVAVALPLLALPHHPGRGSSFAGRAARHGAALSYSLYLSHVPVLSLFAALCIGPQRLPVGPPAFLWLGLGLILAMATAGALWWTFERHTDRVRAWIDAGGLRAGTRRPATRRALP